MQPPDSTPHRASTPQHLGMVGLGKMGLNMTRRLVQGGHAVVGYDLFEENVQAAEKDGAAGAYSLAELVEKLPIPRAVWVMVPAGTPTDAALENLANLLEPGDVIIDGGNSRYTDTILRAERLREAGLSFVDVGTSGGIWGLKEGYSMMIGGDAAIVERLRPLFETLAPSPDKGWGHVGTNGAGHFAKMIHNGIEYGMMQAFAEGFHILEAKKSFEFDLQQVAEIWRIGSVIRSWLLDLCSEALKHNPSLDGLAPYVRDSGEGRWTVAEAIDLDVPAPVITAALLERLRSRLDNSFTDRMLAALREQFGGHAVVRLPDSEQGAGGDPIPPSPQEGGSIHPATTS